MNTGPHIDGSICYGEEHALANERGLDDSSLINGAVIMHARLLE
jgi:hypothetical protein